jgi:hypothetical protein
LLDHQLPPQSRCAVSSPPNGSQTTPTSLPQPSQPLSPFPIIATGLTSRDRSDCSRSPRGIHIESLRIGRGPEFFLFMKLRSQCKWVSFKMMLSKWVEATKLYNPAAVKLDELGGSNQSHPYIAENLCALMLQLGMVEATISDRIITGNYKCEQSRDGLCCVSHSNSHERHRGLLERTLSRGPADERRPTRSEGMFVFDFFAPFH